MRESGEMYLETILVLGFKNKNVRAVDVVEEIGFSKASVSRALAKLKQDNHITVDPHGYIELTRSGRTIAKKIYERHQILSQLLMDLGVDEKTALADACKMEHDISDRSFNAIKRRVKNK